MEVKLTIRSRSRSHVARLSRSQYGSPSHHQNIRGRMMRIWESTTQYTLQDAYAAAVEYAKSQNMSIVNLADFD